jgi:hypothetical protein
MERSCPSRSALRENELSAALRKARSNEPRIQGSVITSHRPEPNIQIATRLTNIGAHEEHAEQFTSTLANVGQELDYLDGPDGHRRWSAPTRR